MTRVRWRLALVVATLFVCLAAAPARAQGAGSSAAADTNSVYESGHNFALSFPQQLWTYLVYPLGEFTIYAERTELPKRVDGWFTNESRTFGLFPQVQIGGETRSGVGARFFYSDLFGREKQAEGVYVFSAGERQTGQLLYRDPAVGGSSVSLDLAADYLQTDNDGATVNGSLLDEEISRFDIERMDATATVGWRSNAGALEYFDKSFSVAGRIGFGQRDVDVADDYLEAVSRGDFARDPLRVEGATPKANRLWGLGEALGFFSIGAQVIYDDRDFVAPASEISHPLTYQLPGRFLVEAGGLYHSFRDIYYPENGGLLRAAADYVTGSDDVRYVRLVAEAQRFHSLFYRNRVLAGRVRLEKVHRVDGGIVPYPDLPTLGGSQRLRGYKRGSLRGEGSLLVALEYRYPIWDTWNAFFFYEEGQVFDEYGDIDTDGFRSSYGGGINLRATGALLVSVRLAHSENENALVGFSLEQEF